MSSEQIWIFTGIFGCVAAGTLAYVQVIQRVGDLKARIVAVEVTLQLMGKVAARTLHSPHTPELDRHLDIYIHRHNEMSFKQWHEVMLAAEVAYQDQRKPKEDRLMAGLLWAICRHKMLMDPEHPKIQ